MKELINDIGKKKLLIIGGAIIGVIVLIIIILLFIGSNKKNTYSQVENKVLAAAQKYYKSNQKLLPKNLNDEISISSTTLSSSGYMKDLDKLVPNKDVNCTATVTVTNIGENNYRYTPKLKCGKDYETKTLKDKIIENNPSVISGQGLYEMNGGYVFRGQNPNNYITFSGRKWRIVKIEDDQVELILSDKYVRSTWDDRYNTERKQTDGINDYSVSRINDFLTNIYNGSEFLSENAKKVVVARNLYIGNRGEDITYNDGSLEKSEVLENKYIGLLPLFDYINASLDTNCSASLDASCANYNYIGVFGFNWWTMTGDGDNTHKVYKIDSHGKILVNRANSSIFVRPVVYLAKDAIYVSGNGTSDNPYIVK